jgi:hypothetical protein
MLFHFLRNKVESEAERVVRHSDTIVANSDYKGELDNDCLDVLGILTKKDLTPALAQIRNELQQQQPQNVDSSGTINLEVTKKFIQNNYDVVRTFLLTNGYIDKPDHTQKWILNDRGKLMKELGGHSKYVKHRRREINIIKNQNFLNWGLIIATALAAIMPWIVEYTKPIKPSIQEIRIDSSWLRLQIINALQKKDFISDSASKKQEPKRIK